MRRMLLPLLSVFFCLVTVSQAAGQNTASPSNGKYGPLVYPELTEEDDDDVTWDGKNVVFPLPYQYKNPEPPIPRIMTEDGTLKDIVGTLKINMKECVSFSWNKLVIESVDDELDAGNEDVEAPEDTTTVMNALPVSGTFSYSTDSMTLVCINSIYGIVFTGPSNHLTIPLPPGNYKHLRFVFLNSDGEEMSTYDKMDMVINCGEMTEIDLCPENSPCINRAKIMSFVVGGMDGEDVVVHSPIKLNAIAIFNENLQRIKFLEVTGFNRCESRYTPKILHFPNEEMESDVYGNSSITFKDLELFPGRNKFHVHGIVKNVCNRSQFVNFQPQVVRFFPKTYSVSFDYTDFGRKDSLSGYIPDWNYDRWGMPPGFFKWEFKSKDDFFSKGELKRHIAYKDKHFTLPFDDLFWSSISVQREGLYLVRKGIVKYWAATSYYTHPSKPSMHIELEKEPARFTTDIIGGWHNVNRQPNKSYRFEGYFKTQTVKSIDTNIKFSASMFNGCERGFIIIPESSYHGKFGMPHDINIYKYRSNIASGESFVCDIKLPEHKERYLCWVYLKVGQLMFLSRTKAINNKDNFGEGGIEFMMEDGNTAEEGIFYDIPDKLEPYTKKLIELADKWVDIYEQCDKNHMRDDALNKRNTDAMIDLFNAYLECDKLCEKTNGKPKGYVTKQPFHEIPYIVEDGLPYTVVSPVRIEAVFFPPRLKAYEEIFKKKEKNSSMSMSMKLETSPDLAIIAKQFPLFLTSIASVTIRLNRKLASGEMLTVKAYVPGDGPDGLQLGIIKEDYMIGGWDMTMNATFLSCVQGISYRQPEKAGDITVYFFINGWGSPSMLNEMKEIVFTNKRLKKKENYMYSGKGFPQNPNVDWMLPWYKKMKEDYLAE